MDLKERESDTKEGKGIEGADKRERERERERRCEGA